MQGTRGELLNPASPHKKLPSVNLAPYLLQYCMELGLFKHGAMGPVPMDWIDIQAWLSITQLTVHPEEARTMIDASRTYVSWLTKSKDMDCGAPYPDVVLNAKI